jgi:hypothetical protein
MEIRKLIGDKEKPGPSMSEVVLIDHIWHGDAASAQFFVILYGAPGTDCFNAMHTAIVQALVDAPSSIVYVVRPVLLDGCLEGEQSLSAVCLFLGQENKPHLAGYGVELTVKDTEYNQVSHLVPQLTT